MCLVKKRKQRLNLHKRRFGSYGSVRFNYTGSNRNVPVRQYPRITVRRDNQVLSPPFSTNFYTSGRLKSNNKEYYYIPPRVNRKDTLDEPPRKRKEVIEIDDDFIEERPPTTVIKDDYHDKYWYLTNGKSDSDVGARIDIALIHALYDGYRKKGIHLFDPLAKSWGLSSISEMSNFKKFSDSLKKSSLESYLKERYGNENIYKDNVALETIKTAVILNPKLSRTFFPGVFNKDEVEMFYRVYPQYKQMTLPVLYKDKIIKVTDACYKWDSQGTKRDLNPVIVDQMQGPIAPLHLIKYVNKVKPTTDLDNELNDASIQQRLMDDDLEKLRSDQEYIRSVLPPELWNKVERMDFEPSVRRRYEKLEDIDVPEDVRTNTSRDYYHKIHIGSRTNTEDNKGTIFKTSDFERRGLRDYLLKQPHFNKVQGEERKQVFNKVFDQLKMWGRSKDKEYYESVLLRVSPDDDKVRTARKQDGKLIFYNKKTN